MFFSPVLLTSLVVEPLRYFFSQAPAGPGGLRWDKDEKETCIEIGSVNDYNKIPIQKKPRILVARGGYGISKSGLTDSLTESKGIVELKGAKDTKHMVWVNGSVQIIIEAQQEGTCELLADMVTHFIAGSRPILCNTLNFKEFGMNMEVGPCEPDKEDREKFKVTLNVPFSAEDHWQVTADSIKFKSMYIEMYNANNPNQKLPLPVYAS
jgi:hypothetical protein